MFLYNWTALLFFSRSLLLPIEGFITSSQSSGNSISSTSSSNLFDSSLCGITWGCFIPDGNYGVAYQLINDYSMKIVLYGITAEKGEYIAVGFASKTKMSNESVIECSSINNEPYSLKFSINHNHNNMRITKEDTVEYYFSDKLISLIDGHLMCSATVNITGSDELPQIFKYNPDQLYYLFLAHGKTSTQGLMKHNHKAISSPRYLVEYSTVFDPSTCGVSKECFIPLDVDCYNGCNGMGVAYSFPNPQQMRLELFSQSNSSTGIYVAVGFSNDDMMGNESVVECSSLGSSPLSLKFSYNIYTPDEPTNQRINNYTSIDTALISESFASYSNGMIYCTGLINITGYPSNPQVFKFDPQEIYYLLMAFGPTMNDGSGLLAHHIHDATSNPSRLSQIRNSTVVDLSECGITKGCFQSDGLGVTYRQVSSSVLFLELYATIPTFSSDRWIAVGFSNDANMGNESVIECSMMKGQNNPSIKFSYNDDTPANIRITGEQNIRPTLVSDEVSSFYDGLLYCSAYVRVDGTANSKIFNYSPSQNYYLLIAAGPTDATTLLVHDVNAVSLPTLLSNYTSQSPFVVSTINPSPQSPSIHSTTKPTGYTTSAASIHDGLFDGSSCGKTKGCFLPTDCNGECSGMGFSYQVVNSNQMRMELFVRTSSGNGQYVAVGFSKDNKMGSESVIECSALIGEQLTMKFSYNAANVKNNVRINNEENIEEEYFTNTTTVYTNGQLYCTSLVTVTGWNGSNEVFDFNPSQSYYTLLASGSTTKGGLTKHIRSAVPAASVYLNTSSNIPQGTSGMSATTKQRLIKAHAIMMVIAWFCFVPTAFLFARILRSNWPNVKIGGLLVWFQFHRDLNIIGITLMIASFVCILVANSWKWTGPGAGSGKWSEAHSMIGIISLSLAWIQPFISLLRCAPTNSNRIYFNWIHRIIGIFAMILASTALSISTKNMGIGTNNNEQFILSLIPIAIITTISLIFTMFNQTNEDDKIDQVAFYQQLIVFVGVIVLVAVSACLSILLTSSP